MSSFSGVTFVLFRFRFRCCAFIEAAALRSIVLRYAGAPTATSQSGDVTFSEYLSLLYGEYVVRFPLPVGAFYLVTTGWILTSTHYVRIQSINHLLSM